ncbi:MAG TPA: tetratricopeptide repeat protein [Stellaceae bacterium]|nr:tetratricopeptide repeat protein [Stellaceae bacterium]
MLRLKRKPKKTTETPLDRADRARDAGDWALAVRHYREALAQESGNPAIWVQYGHALKESGNVAEAEKAYRKSIELDGRVADTHLQLGHALKIQGRRDDAAAAYFRALALEQTVPPAALELLGLCWEPIGRLEAGWRQHIPTFLNAVASVTAFAHEQARLAREVEQLHREIAVLRERDRRPLRADGAAAVLPGLE